MINFENIWQELKSNKEILKALNEKEGLSFALSKIISSLGLSLDKSIELINPDLNKEKLFNIDIAAYRIKKAIENKEKILVYGDYDVDGMSATAIFISFLRFNNAICKYFIPNRYDDGYGLNTNIYKENKDIDLIITVDCGINSHEEIEFFKNKNIDIIVTDHHEIADNLPNCISINPKIGNYSQKDISASLVSWHIVKYLENNFSYKNQDYIDILAGLGTIADVMPLLEDNRYIVKKTLIDIENEKHYGLNLLMKKNNINKRLNAIDIAFSICPVINSSGRMGEENLGIKLLLMEDIEKTTDEIIDINIKRRQIQQNIILDIENNIDLNDNFIIAKGNWLAGVLGVVASFLANKYKKTTILVNEIDLSGSARAYGDFDLYKLLNENKKYFCKFGGHKSAAGFTFVDGGFDDFKNRLNKSEFNFSLESKKRYGYINLSPEFYNLDILNDLDILEPFGKSFNQINFLMKNVHVNSCNLVGKNKNTTIIHSTYNGVNIRIIKFEQIPIESLREYDILVNIKRNLFRGIETISYFLVDYRLSNKDYIKNTDEYFNHYYNIAKSIKRYNTINYSNLVFDRYIYYLKEEEKECKIDLNIKSFPSKKDILYNSIELVVSRYIRNLPDRLYLVKYYKILCSDNSLDLNKVDNIFSFFLTLIIFEEIGLITFKIINKTVFYEFNKFNYKLDLKDSKSYENITLIKEDYNEY